MSTPPSLPPLNEDNPTVTETNQNPNNASDILKAGTIGLLGCTGITVLVLGLMLLLGMTTVNNVLSGISSIFQIDLVPASAAEVVPSRTIIESIQPLGQLVSLNVQVAKADVYVGVQQGALNTCGFAANHVVQGAIEAGIDLATFHESQVTYDAATNTYTLHLPSPRLTGCHIEYIRQYDRSTTACNVDWDEARLLANYASLVEFRDDALEGGILDSAQRQASLVIRNFASALTGANVVVEFAEADAVSTLPATCQPDVPTGWSYDSSANAWIKQ